MIKRIKKAKSRWDSDSEITALEIGDRIMAVRRGELEVHGIYTVTKVTETQATAVHSSNAEHFIRVKREVQYHGMNGNTGYVQQFPKSSYYSFRVVTPELLIEAEKYAAAKAIIDREREKRRAEDKARQEAEEAASKAEHIPLLVPTLNKVLGFIEMFPSLSEKNANDIEDLLYRLNKFMEVE